MNTLTESLEALPSIVRQTGRKSENQHEVSLKAGALRAVYSKGSLRYISYGRNELLRMIYPAVRDKNWLTLTPYIEKEEIEAYEDSFFISIHCLYRSADISFYSSYVIAGAKDNSITFSMDGKTLGRSVKNRIGFCVLHPVEGCAGRNCVIIHPDGSVEHTLFPEEIEPHQVFRDIKSMIWQVSSIRCRVDFEGDIFETEDQRNWTDASFKTYSTPLSVPFPVILDKDAVIKQKVTFKTDSKFGTYQNPDEQILIRLFPGESSRLPSIGISRAEMPGQLSINEIRTLRMLRFDHYRIDLQLYNDDWHVKADVAASEAADLGYRIEFALFFDDDFVSQTTEFAGWYYGKNLPVSAILIYHRNLPSTPDTLASYVIPALRLTDPDIKFATGTNANFAQLNRDRPGETGNDCICFSIQPQEHASDDATLVENLKAQEYCILSAKRFAGGKDIMISPVTIQRRFNANNVFVRQGDELLQQVDSRLLSLFGGCWTAGSLKFLCEAGADSITFYESRGEKGIFQGDLDSRWPLVFPAVKGMVFPVYHVFRFLLTNKSMSLLRSVSSKPLITDCLALTDGKQVRMILVNYTSVIRSLKFECCSGLFRMRTLNNESYIEASSDSRWTGKGNEKVIKSDSVFELDPYSINFIEGWRKH